MSSLLRRSPSNPPGGPGYPRGRPRWGVPGRGGTDNALLGVLAEAAVLRPEWDSSENGQGWVADAQGSRLAWCVGLCTELHITDLVADTDVVAERPELPPEFADVGFTERNARFSPDGAYLAATAGDRLVLVDTKRATALRSAYCPKRATTSILPGHQTATSSSHPLTRISCRPRLSLATKSRPPRSQSASFLLVARLT